MEYTDEQLELISAAAREMYEALKVAESQLEGLMAWLKPYQPMVAKGTMPIIEQVRAALAKAEGVSVEKHMEHIREDH